MQISFVIHSQNSFPTEIWVTTRTLRKTGLRYMRAFIPVLASSLDTGSLEFKIYNWNVGSCLTFSPCNKSRPN